MHNQISTRDAVHNEHELDVERVTRIRDWLVSSYYEEYRTYPHSRVAYLLPALETPKGPVVGFGMGYWKYTRRDFCENVCCIGGTAQLLYGTSEDTYVDTGRQLGLSEFAADALFFPGDRQLSNGCDAYAATPVEVARVLTHLIETNIVDWSKG